MNYYENKVVVITGGAGALGTAITQQLILKNAQIALLDINEKALHNAKVNSDIDIYIRQTDLCQISDCEIAINDILKKFGKIDILINCAGITHIAPLQKDNGSIFEKVISVNVIGTANITMMAIKALKKTKGHIVALSSVAGFAPLFGRTAYSASKHALHGLFNTLRAELLEDQVKVSIVCPTFIESGIRSDTKDSIYQSKVTTGEILTPTDAATLLLNGVAKKKRLILIGKTAKLAYWANKFFPKWYEKRMLKGINNL